MKAVLVNYNYTPEWLLEYPSIEATIYDRSDDGIERDLTKYGKVYKTKNLGDVDYDKLGYLIEFYDNLPDIFLWGKTNLFKYVDEQYFKEKLKEAQFAPLLKFDHRTYSDKFGEVCRYMGSEHGSIYAERSDSWYFNTIGVDAYHYRNWRKWSSHFGLPQEAFTPFAPGGNYILTKERVHRYSKQFYEEMRNALPHSMHPAEAHAAERSYFYLWQ